MKRKANPLDRVDRPTTDRDYARDIPSGCDILRDGSGDIRVSNTTDAIQAQGHSNVHVGNTTHHGNAHYEHTHQRNTYYGPTVIYGQRPADSSSDRRDDDRSIVENRRRELLQTLRFEQMDTRHDTIRRAHSRSCRWLLDHQTYLDWLNDEKLGQHYGVLWIRGKPGAGKSTLMKFALKQSGKSGNTTSVSFFFHARGSDLEKSTVGMYRSLLLQLLERNPRLQSVLDSPRLTTGRGSERKWSEESLQELFEEAVESLGQDSLVCFIDALDECGCDEGRIRDMLSFMLQIGESAVEAGSRFRICFSSRHYPKITIDRPLSMDLERQLQHGQDIERYIASELRIGATRIARQVKEEIQTKALGVFMWVVLVVGILNKTHDGGNVHALQQRLREIPGDLQGLFHDIVARDGHNKDKLLLCVQWVLFAERPLSPKILYCAIFYGTDANALANWNPIEVTDVDMEHFILDISKGLTEVTTSDAPTVQFIHESVRDFFLMSDGLSRVWPDLSNTNFPCQSHGRIKQCCLVHIRACTFTYMDEDESDHGAHLLHAQGYREFARQMPLLEYAVLSILYHAENAEKGGSDQTAFLESFPLDNWSRIRYFIPSNHRSNWPNRRYTMNASFLYILAAHDLEALIKRYPANHSGFEMEDQRHGAPILVALAYGSNAAAQALVDIKLAAEPSDPLLHDVCNQFREQIRDYDMSTARTDAYLYDFNKVSTLTDIVGSGNIILFEFFLALHGLKLDEEDSEGKTPLSHASASDGWPAPIALHLLESGTEVDSRDEDGRTPLSHAAGCHQSTTAELLLEWGAEVDSRDKNGRTPLSYAASVWEENSETVRLLLDSGAEVDSRDNDGRTPLSHAANSWGDKGVSVRLLLVSGAEVDSRDQNGLTPLVYALKRGNDSSAKLLLDRGASTVGFY